MRAKAGLCPVCGKTPIEFEKYMRVYCSKECRQEYASKFTTWSAVRSKIFQRDGRECKKCKITREKKQEKINKLENERMDEWIKNNKEEVEHRRDEMLVQLSKQFEQDYKNLMDDRCVIKNHFFWKLRNEVFKGINHDLPTFEVDHIIAIGLGGDMWNEKNMQVLCYDCHKEKTKKDMKKMKVKNSETNSILL